MGEPYCEHCELPLAQCVHGMPKAERPSPSHARLVANGPTIISRTHSECPGCGDDIGPGERITLTEDGWVHADEVDQPKPPATDSNIFEGL